MELCSIYHLKWHVIHDRLYEHVPIPSSTAITTASHATTNTNSSDQIKSIEEIRQRYYQVNRLLLNARHQNLESIKFSYDSVKGASIRNNLKVWMSQLFRKSLL